MLVGDDGGGEQDQRGSDAEPEAGAAGERVAGAVDELCAEHRVRDAPRVLQGSGDGLPDGLPLGAGDIAQGSGQVTRETAGEDRAEDCDAERGAELPGGAVQS
jgi:hypothetical protein